MIKSSVCLLLLGILGACICGGRTSECNGNAKISLLTSIHDDSTCTMTSSRGVIMSEAAKMFIETHNSKNNNLKIGLNIFIYLLFLLKILGIIMWLFTFRSKCFGYLWNCYGLNNCCNESAFIK